MENPCYRLRNKKALYFVFGNIFFISIIFAVTTGSRIYAFSNAYYSGFDYGCADAGISDPDDRYINQPGKGPAFHTISFMNGYKEGFYFCTGNSETGLRIHN